MALIIVVVSPVIGEQALAALNEYHSAVSETSVTIRNKPAYLMGILRKYKQAQRPPNGVEAWATNAAGVRMAVSHFPMYCTVGSGSYYGFSCCRRREAAVLWKHAYVVCVNEGTKLDLHVEIRPRGIFISHGSTNHPPLHPSAFSG